MPYPENRRPENFDRIEHAFVRRPGKNLAEGISPASGVPDFKRALIQHTAFTEALNRCGVATSSLPADTLFPDGCFISDVAVVTDKLAVICNFADNNPRQGEQQAVAAQLGATRFLKYVTPPGRLDAADVLKLGDRFYIGLTDHTNRAGAEQLTAYLGEFGLEAQILDVSSDNVLRLDAAATYLGRDRILIREDLARNYAFLEYEKILVPLEEKHAAAAMMVNGTLLVPAGAPKTRDELRMSGISSIEVDVSEFEKLGGGLSCLALTLAPAERGNVVLIQDWSHKVA